jgi:hypothetical protein
MQNQNDEEEQNHKNLKNKIDFTFYSHTQFHA